MINYFQWPPGVCQLWDWSSSLHCHPLPWRNWWFDSWLDGGQKHYYWSSWTLQSLSLIDQHRGQTCEMWHWRGSGWSRLLQDNMSVEVIIMSWWCHGSCLFPTLTVTMATTIIILLTPELDIVTTIVSYIANSFSSIVNKLLLHFQCLWLFLTSVFASNSFGRYHE